MFAKLSRCLHSAFNRHSAIRRRRLNVVAVIESLESREVLTATSFTDFLPAGYQYGPNSASDPVFQQAYAAWVATMTPTPGTGTPTTSSGGPGILSDIWTMASNPWATTTGLVSGIGTTFMDGSAADSLGGATVQMAATMFGWTEIPIFQVENAEPLFGNQDAFTNGQTVGVVWGTANNVALLAYSVYNLPANIQSLANVTGSLVVTTTEGLQIVVGGTATIEAAVPVVVNGAIAIDATIALASGSPSGTPSNPASSGLTGNSTLGVGTTAQTPNLGGASPEGWWCAIMNNDTVYVGHAHMQAMELAGSGSNVQAYGMVRLDAAGNVVEACWGYVAP